MQVRISRRHRPQGRHGRQEDSSSNLTGTSSIASFKGKSLRRMTRYPGLRPRAKCRRGRDAWLVRREREDDSMPGEVLRGEPGTPLASDPYNCRLRASGGFCAK